VPLALRRKRATIPTMTQITLEQWAADHGVPYRTAQLWARQKKINAQKKRLPIIVEKTALRYVIDPETQLPEIAS